VQAVAVPARIDADNALQVLDGLREATRGVADGPVALDLSELREFDSSALSLLLQLVREREGAGSGERAAASNDDVPGVPADASTLPLFLLNPPEKLQELAELYGVHEMLFGVRRGANGHDGQGGEVRQDGQATEGGGRSRS
jgi:ABC-type transporter Mla MlaB component